MTGDIKCNRPQQSIPRRVPIYTIEERTLLKQTKLHRIKKIEITQSDAIDRIKIIYSDGRTWSNGHADGSSIKRTIVLTKSEYLIRITHERFLNKQFAGAAVEFETNKGRTFKYHPFRMTTNWKDEQTTINAQPGHEIIGLRIHEGVLTGSEQQHVPKIDIIPPIKDWYVIATTKQKEDDPFDNSNIHDIHYEHFYIKEEALKKWRNNTPFIEAKQGRGSILIDCTQSKVTKTAGDDESVTRCICRSVEEGYCLENIKDNDSLVHDIAKALLKFASIRDWLRIIIFILVEAIHCYLDCEAVLVFGDFIKAVSTNQTDLYENWYAEIYCNVVHCDGSNIILCKALIFSYIVIKLIKKSLHFLNIYLSQTSYDIMTYQLRCQTFSHLLSLDLSFFDNNSPSDIRHAMNADALNNQMMRNIPNIVSDFCRYMILAYYIIKVDMMLGGLCILVILFIQFYVLLSIGKLERQFHTLHQKLEAVTFQIIDEVIKMILSVKMISKEQYHMDEYDICQKRVMNNFITILQYRTLREYAYYVLRGTNFGVIIYFSINYVKTSNITGGTLISLYFLIRDLPKIFEKCTKRYDELITEFPDIQRFMTFMEQRPSIVDGFLKPEMMAGEIEFNNVYFAYPSRPEEEVLKGFTQIIKPNKITAIVGDSGSGKSTITKLLLRLYDPTSGIIKIDGHDIRNFDRSYLRECIGIVNQNPILFNKSIAYNIGYGMVQNIYTDDDVNTAATLASCDFVNKFHGGFETLAATGGSNLSGGQAQRIALARAVIRDPRILVLDEATSSLDAENERKVKESMENLMVGKTILLIAHRLCTVKDADEIVCMKNGQVIERGAHNKLMRKERRGIYHSLVFKQIIEDKNTKLPPCKHTSCATSYSHTNGSNSQWTW